MVKDSKAVVTVWILILLITFGLLAGYGKVVSDLTFFLSRGASDVEKLMLNELRQGSGTGLVIISIGGKDETSLSETSSAFLKLLKNTGKFRYVSNGSGEIPESDSRLLMDYRYLLSDRLSPEYFSSENLEEELNQRLLELTSPAGILIKDLITKDPTAEFLSIAKKLAGGDSPEIIEGVWFSSDGTKALLIGALNIPPFEIDKQEKLLKRIKKDFNNINHDGSLNLTMTGPAVFSVESKNNIKSEAQMMSISAFVVLAIFLFYIFRSLPLLALCGLPLATGIASALWSVTLAFGYIHSITIAFGVTIIGVAIDYPLHLLVHKKEGESVDQTLAGIWSTLRLGVITTSVGYSAMLFSDFTGLNQLALFSITGIIASALSVRFLLPKIISKDFSLPASAYRIIDIKNKSNSVGRLKYPAYAIAIISLLLLVTAGEKLWDDDLSRLSPVSEKSEQLDQLLRDELKAPDVSRLIAIKGDSIEAVLQKSELVSRELKKLKELEMLEGFETATTYLPSIKMQKERKEAIPGERELRKNLTAALNLLPFKKQVFEPFLQALLRSKEMPPLTKEMLGNSMVGIKVSSLLRPFENGWSAVIPLHGVKDENALSMLIGSLDDKDIHYLNLKGESTAMISGYRQEALKISLIGVAIITAILFWGLRSLKLLTSVLITVGAPIAIVGAILFLSTGGLSIFHLVSALLVMGLGIDYALFLNRPRTDESGSEERLLLGVAICSLSTILVFGILAASNLYVLKAIGSTVALGALFCLIFGEIMARKEP